MTTDSDRPPTGRLASPSAALPPQGPALALPLGQDEPGYRLLFDRHPWPMWVYDVPTLRFLAVNQAAVQAYGWSEAEFLQLGLADIRPESERERFRAHVALPVGQRPDDRHWRHQRRDGQLIDVEIASEAITFNGRAARLVLAKDITQRLQAEAALRASEQRYRDIVDNATEGIWRIDTQARTDFVNPAMARMLGYRADEMIGRPLTDFMDAEAQAETERNLARRRQGVSETHDFRFRHRDGRAVWTTVATNPLRDESGAYTGAMALVTDITARRQADEQIKLLATSVARFNDMVIITEAEPFDEPGQRILFVNDAFERRTGYTRAEVLGRSTRLLQGPGTDQAELRRIGAALRQWQPVRAELLNYTKAGEEFWVALDIVPIADDAGNYTHWVAVEHDITDQKRHQARDAARAQVLGLIAGGAPLSEVLQAIVAGLQAGHRRLLASLLLLDAGGSRLQCAAAPELPASFSRALQAGLDDPQSSPASAAIHQGRRIAVPDLPQDPRWPGHRTLAAQAGLAACWAEPVCSPTGAVLGVLLAYHRQPHQTSAAEAGALAEAARLAALAVVRKREDEALRESQKLEALGTLAGGMAHDFNNILGVILGNLALVAQDGGLPAPQGPRLQQVQQSALRARHLVQQILAFSRRQPHQAVRQPLAPLVQEAVALLRATLPAQVRLQTQLAPEALWPEVDANQMQQVLVNLGTNAWQAMDERGGLIEIGLETWGAEAAAMRLPPPAAAAAAALPPGALAHLWVRDTGAGMSDAVRARIFEPFFTTKPVGIGTGLGLSVVHGIVAEHQGSISVESVPGQGSTFHLLLPAAAPATAARTQPGALAPVAAGANPAFALPILGPNPQAAPAPGPRILCVDDDAVVLMTLAALLQSHGFAVSTAASGAQALALLQPATPPAGLPAGPPPDLVVTDFNMPDMSGLALAQALAAQRPGLPVVICSGYIDAELTHRAAALGVRALVHKAQSAEDLPATVRRVLGGAVAAG